MDKVTGYELRASTTSIDTSIDNNKLLPKEVREMKKRLGISIILLLVFAFFSVKYVGRAEELTNETCPVMGGKVNPEIFTEYKGQKVYFCCPGCLPMFKKNPEKYVEKLPQFAKKDECPMHLGNKVICPVMGRAFNITEESEKSMYQGKVYYFCCPGCKPLFEKNPEKYLKEAGK